MPAIGDHPGLKLLDVGCGIHKPPGAIGLDRNPASRADVIVELDRFPYPFRDQSFDQVRAIHVIEHVSDVVRTMEEFSQLLDPQGGAFQACRFLLDTSKFRDSSLLTSFKHHFPQIVGGIVVVAEARALTDANVVDVDVVENRQPEPQLDVVRGSHVREAAESGALVEHDLEARDRTRDRDEREHLSRAESEERRRAAPGQPDKPITALLHIRRR